MNTQPKKGARRAAARVAAVQALYQIEMSGAPPSDVIAEFRDHRLDKTADAELFALVVATAATRRAEIDKHLKSALAEGWTVQRLDAVLRALLRASVGELIESSDVPVRVVLDQYMDVAHSFADGKEAGFVNGVLDRLARQLRPQEVEASGVRAKPEER